LFFPTQQKGDRASLQRGETLISLYVGILSTLLFSIFRKALTYRKRIKLLKALILAGMGIMPSVLITLSTLRTLGVLLGQELA